MLVCFPPDDPSACCNCCLMVAQQESWMSCWLKIAGFLDSSPSFLLKFNRERKRKKKKYGSALPTTHSPQRDQVHIYEKEGKRGRSRGVVKAGGARRMREQQGKKRDCSSAHPLLSSPSCLPRQLSDFLLVFSSASLQLLLHLRSLLRGWRPRAPACRTS